MHECLFAFMKNKTMNDNNAFAEELKKRTKKFGVDVILFCESLKSS